MNTVVGQKEKGELCGFCASSGIKARYLNDYEEKCGDCLAGTPPKETLTFPWLAAQDEIGRCAEMAGEMKAMFEPGPRAPGSAGERAKARSAREILRDEVDDIDSFCRRIDALEARIRT
jgi:hypothetical protein